MSESLMKCVSIQSSQIVCTFQRGICRRIAVSNQEMRSEILDNPDLEWVGDMEP